MLDRKRFRLDGLDVLILLIGLAAATAVAVAFDFRQQIVIELAFGGSILAMGLRRKLSPRSDELMFDEVPRQVTSRVIFLLSIGIGGTMTLMGAIAGAVFTGAVIEAELPAIILLVPTALSGVGIGLVVFGMRRLRGKTAAPAVDPYRAIIPPTPDQSRGILPP